MRGRRENFVYCWGTLLNCNTTWQWELVTKYKEIDGMWTLLQVEIENFNWTCVLREVINFKAFLFYDLFLNSPTEIKTKRELKNMDLWEERILPSDIEK